MTAESDPSASQTNLPREPLAEAREWYQTLLDASASMAAADFAGPHPDGSDRVESILQGLRLLHEEVPRNPTLSTASADHRSDTDTRHPPGSMDEVPIGILGDFRLMRQIGRGGMGIVYEAWQTSLSRRVALKILPFAAVLDARQMQRFKNEAQAAASFDHPHIVSVYFVGCERGIHFYAMQYVDGQSLSELIAEIRLDLRAKTKHEDRWSPDLGDDGSGVPRWPEADRSHDTITTPLAAISTECGRDFRSFCRTVAMLGIQAARALEHAHNLGIVHRDIKPSNLLLDDAGNLFIADFGLAVTQDTSNLTLTGDVLGTPRYMSPEQANGQKLLDHRTDIYSLGMVLYELLTLESPFPNESRQHLLESVVHRLPRRPRSIEPRIPVDLETIVLKAVSKQPDARYATADDLASDLQRFLECKSIHARRTPKLEQAWRWCRRNSVVSTLVATLLLVLLSGLVGFGWQWSRAHRHAQRADQEAARFRRFLYYSDIKYALEKWEDQDVGEMLGVLRQYASSTTDADLRGFEWYYLWNLAKPNIVVPAFDFSPMVSAVSISRSGTELLALGDNGFRKWAISTGATLASREINPSGISSLSGTMDRNGTVAAYGHEDGMIALVNLETGDIDWIKAHDVYVWSLAFSADGQVLASADGEGKIKLWDVATRRQRAELNGHTDRVYCLSFSPDGHLLASGSKDQTARLWSIQDRTTVRLLDVRPLCDLKSSVWSLGFAPNGQQLAMGTSGDALILIWEISTGRLIHRYQGNGWVPAVAFAPDSKRVAFASGPVKIWDLERGEISHTLDSPGVRSITFAADGIRLATGSEAGNVKLWTLDDLPTEPLLKGHAGNIDAVAFAPDDQTLASASEDGEIRLWDPRTSKLLHQIQGHEHSVTSISFAPDGKTLASAGLDRAVNLWNTQTGQLVDRLAFEQRVSCVEYSPNGHVLAIGTGDPASDSPDGRGTLLLWDVATRRKIATLRGHAEWVRDVAYSPDGELIVTVCSDWNRASSGDPVVRIWKASNHELLAALEGHKAGVRTVAFSPCGTTLATAGDEGIVLLWDVASRSRIRSLDTRAKRVYCVVFTADGKSLVTVSDGLPVQFWNVETGELRFSMSAHAEDTSFAAISHNGNTLATASNDDTIRLWRAATRDEVLASGW